MVKPLDRAQLRARTDLFASMQKIARTETLPRFRTPANVENKNAPGEGFDPVTESDRACEKALRTAIESAFPQDGIIGEEFGTTRPDAAFVWVIDPIDGTRAYVAGVPLWGMLVGVMYHGKPVASLAHQPFVDEAFMLSADGPSWSQNNQSRPLKTRSCSDLNKASMMTTTPALFNQHERPVYDAIEAQVQAIRYGTDWYGYALVAAGTCDIVIETGLGAYDILPLVALIEAAGGQVTDWSGASLSSDPTSFTGQVLAVGDPALAEIVLPRLKSAAL